MAGGTFAAAIPCIGVIGAEGRLARGTDAFRRLWTWGGEPPSEIAGVANGELDRCTVAIAGVTLAVEAASDQSGTGCALLSGSTSCQEENALLAEPLDES